MDILIRFLRAAALAAAVLVLPCCRDEVGGGDEVNQVTVRASLNLAKIEPNDDCLEPSISSNGRWLVWASSSNVITPNDNNGRRDIFLKDRETGKIFNLTDPFVPIFVGTIVPDDCYDPTVSDDGNFVAFRSKGAWKPFFAPGSTWTNDGVWRLNRSSGTIVYERAFAGGAEPDAPLLQPSISADGRKVAFKSSATNLAIASGGTTQIFHYDFGDGVVIPPVMTLVSKQAGAALNTPCNVGATNPRISADGNFVLFESNSTNLNAGTAGLPKPQVYRGTAAGGNVLPVATNAIGGLTTTESYFANISADGRYVVFHSTDDNLTTPPGTEFDYIYRKDLVGGQVDVVTDQPGYFPVPIFPNGFTPSVSADGRMVAFISSDSTLAGGVTLNHPQVFVRDLLTGKALFCSRHKDGTPSNLDNDTPRISADGKWVVWSTQSSTLVDGDTNGLSDIFLRGPLR